MPGSPMQRRLERLYREPKVKEFLDRLEETAPDEREPVTTVEELAEQLGWSRSDAVQVLSQLGSKGKVGEYRLGRRGSSTRLEWSYTPLSVRACARGELDDPLPLPEDDEDERGHGLESRSQPPLTLPPAAPASPTLHGTKPTIFLPLRGGEITVVLPPDLTRNEAEEAISYLEYAIAIIRKKVGL